MGEIADILATVRKGPEFISKVNSIKLNTKSIARGAQDAILQFPCLISNTVPIDMANTTARTLDRVYASFAQHWFSLNQEFDITIDPTPASYIKKLHQNLAIESVENLIIPDEEMDKYMEAAYDGSYRVYTNKDQTFNILIDVRENVLMGDHNRKLLDEYLADYDFSPLETFTEADDDGTTRASDMANAVLDGARKKAENEARKNNITASLKKNGPTLLDRDVKRSNEMLPLAIGIKLAGINDNKELVQYFDIVLGIKTILHPISSADMVDNISRVLENKNILFKFLKWTTGEISFVKDFLLNVNDIKADAIARSNGKSPIFAHLKKLRNKRIGVRNITVPNAFIPNASIVITPMDMEDIRNRTGVDLEDERNAMKVMDALFLMTFIILDEGSGTLKVLYDGQSSYQYYSIDVLERDNANLMNQNRLGKELGRMLAR